MTVLEFACLAQDTHSNSNQPILFLRKHHWQRIDLKVPGLNYNNPFFARLYIRHISTNTVDAAVIAYRGTQAIQHIDNDIDDIEIILSSS